MADDDIFAAAVDLDESHLKQGFEEGHSHGLELGEIEGREVGLRAGFEVGEELGFYSGCTQVWIALAAKGEILSGRSKRGIEQLRDLLREYPVLDHEDEKLQEKLAAIRSKFKAVASMLGARLEYQGMPNASSGEAASF